MTKKQDYVEPVVIAFTVQSEGVICQSINSIIIEDAILEDWGTL